MPKPKHPLRQIRAASPHATQAAFAGFLGVPVPVIQAVESGKVRITPRLAAHIRELTGADDVELLRGMGGAARTLSGRRYTTQAFEAWQGSPQQADERARRETLRSAQRAGWMRYLDEAAPGRDGNGGVPDADGIVAVEDLLTPWQTCEFASDTAGGWKRLPESLQRLTGWSPQLPVSSRTRLTLAVQAAPAWNPDTAPPGLAAPNAELFPPCYFTVAAGSRGCRVAAAFWEALCREHAIDPDNGRPLRDAPTGSWRGFFRSQGGRCEPHAVFAGIEPDDTAAMSRALYSPDSFLYGPAGAAPADGVLEFMEAHTEDAGSPAGILLFASLEGSGTGLPCNLLLENLRARFPAAPVLVIGVLPPAGVSPAGAAPWHVALAMQAIRRHARAALLFSDDLLAAQASRVWHLRAPGDAGANRIIAECLSAFTAPLRFGGSDAPPVDLATLIEGFPAAVQGGLPVITGQCWPLASLTDRRMKSINLPWLVHAALKAAVRAHLLSADSAAVAAFLRVRLKPGPEWISGGEPPVLSFTGRTGIGLHESASVFAPAPVIRRALKRLARQAAELWSAESAAAVCAGFGVSEDELRTTIAEMAR